MAQPSVNLLPGESQLKDGRIQTTPLSVLQRRRRYEQELFPVGGTGAIVDGGTLDFQLPQSDLLESVIVNIQCTILTNGSTYTTVTFNSWPNPVPWGIIKSCSLSGNGGSVNIFNLSGWGCSIYSRTRKDVDIFATGTTDKYCGNAQALVGSANPAGQTRAFNAGAVAAATTYSFCLSFEIPIAYNKQGEMALLMLQNNAIFTLRFQWANLLASLGGSGTSSDIITNTTSTGNVGGTLAGNVRCMGRFFSYLPEDLYEYSQQYSNIKAIGEQIYPIQNGTNVIPLVRNDTFTWIGVELYNNGNPIAWTNISNIKLFHSNNQILAFESAYTHVASRFLDSKKWALDGFIEFDMRQRMGMQDHFDLLDAFPDRNIQNLSIGFDIAAGLSLTGVQGARVMTEALVAAS